MAGGAVVLQVDQAASEDSVILRRQRERRQDADLDRRFGLRADRDHQKANELGCHSLHYFADSRYDAV